MVKVPSLGGTPPVPIRRRMTRLLRNAIAFPLCLLLYAFTIAGFCTIGGGSNYCNDVYVSPSRAVFLLLGALLGDPPSD